MSETKVICDGKNRPFMLARNEKEKTVIFFQPRCKLWSCPACAEINRGLWAMRAYHGVTELAARGLTLMFTTVTNHEKLSPEYAYKLWPQQWKKLRQRARRAARMFEYLLIPERHQSGKMHIHLLNTGELSERWWKDNSRQCGLGHQDKSKQIDVPEMGAWYTTKYLAKQLEDTSWPRGHRHVRTSQHWPRPELTAPAGFDFLMVPRDRALAEMVSGYETIGYDVLVLDHQEAWQVVGYVDNLDLSE
jgi:hypothetical protein